MSEFLTVHESISIPAPIERCFALSTRVELVKETLGMRVVSGVASGHVEAGSRVVWRGWKFGWPTEHHTLITGFEAPHPVSFGAASDHMAKEAFFQDTQEHGRFAFFQHDHHFREEVLAGQGWVTVLRDEVRFTLPFGAAGRVFARVVMRPHIAKLARQRFTRIKALAEGDGWREWIASEAAAGDPAEKVGDTEPRITYQQRATR